MYRAKTYILLILIIDIMTGCASRRNESVSQQNHNDSWEIAYPVSGNTQLFLKKYRLWDATPASETKNEDLKKLCKSYNLKQLPDSSFVLCGFIKTDSLFNPALFTQNGIHLNPPAGDMRTVCIPLDKLKFFFTQKGIVSFESSTPINPL